MTQEEGLDQIGVPLVGLRDIGLHEAQLNPGRGWLGLGKPAVAPEPGQPGQRQRQNQRQRAAGQGGGQQRG